MLAACSSKGASQAPPDAGADAGVDAGPTLNIAWDWVGVVGTGQSLSVGAFGSPVQTSQPSNNLKLSLGTLDAPTFDPTSADATSAQLSMVPLVETIRPVATGYPSAYPRNIYGQTPHTAMANELTALAQQASAPDYLTVHTVVGESGQPMTVIDKAAVQMTGVACATGTAAGYVCTMGRAYASTLFEAKAIARLASTAGKTYGIGAIVITHGESDAGSTRYANDLFQLWSDYNADLLPITGQTASIPMLVSQQHSVPSNPGSSSTSAAQQVKAGVDHPGDIVCVGPKYQYPYATADTTHVHLDTPGYNLLGEKFAQVYFERVVAGHDWQPLQPVSVERSGTNALLVHFHVPTAPLVWDDALPAPHAAGTPWAMGRGFEVTAAGARQTIDAVDIVPDDAGASTIVKITCHSDLTGLAAVVVSYAMTTDGTNMPASALGSSGTGTFRWGHLKDSDPFVGTVTNTAQPNYCVAFQMNVP